jgi:hypothetical protein
LHEPLKSQLPSFAVGFQRTVFPLQAILSMHVGMGHFVYIRYQKSIRVQIGIDGDFGLPVRQYTEIAKAGSAWFRTV